MAPLLMTGNMDKVSSLLDPRNGRWGDFQGEVGIALRFAARLCKSRFGRRVGRLWTKELCISCHQLMTIKKKKKKGKRQKDEMTGES